MGYFRNNIEALDGYVPGFQPGDRRVVKLNTNENPYPPSPRVMEAIGELSADDLRRYPPAMGDGFRRAAAALHRVVPDAVLCVNGGDDLLTIAMRAFCDGNRAVAFPGPTYSLYPVLAGIQNAEAIEVPFGPDFGIPEQLEHTGAALIILCNPNAPSGSFIPPEAIGAFAKKMAGRSIVLVDEAYVDFAEDNCVRLIEDHENAIILRSMSKGYSLAGIRFGYALAQPGLISGLTKVKDSYNVNALSIAAATAAIQDQDYHRETVAKVKAERARLTDGLRAQGFAVSDSAANFVLAARSSPPSGELYRELADRRIFVRYFRLRGLQDKLRITVGTPEQNTALLDALKEITG